VKTSLAQTHQPPYRQSRGGVRTLFVNGSTTQLGYRVAQRLHQHPAVRLIHRASMIPLEFTHGDMLVSTAAAQQLVTWLRAEQVDTLIHLDVLGEDAPTTNHEAALQHNVMGTLTLLGACAAAGVRRVVVRSSTLVYGARANHPAFISEDTPVQKARKSGLLRDYCELDTLTQSFARSHPQMEVIILRCASIVGDQAWSPLTAYLTQRTPPVLIGFSPRIQVLHPDDAADAVVQAALGDACGSFNLAALEPIPLDQAIRLTGRQPRGVLPIPIALAGALGQRKQLTGWFADLEFLVYPCVADLRRAMHSLHWQPRHSAYDLLRGLASLHAAPRATPPRALPLPEPPYGERARD